MINILKIIFRYIRLPIKNYLKYKIKKEARKNLINKDFTIISSTCIGGVIYNFCGEKFNSPTIDLWIKQPDFCEFCSKLEYYLQQELKFIKMPERKCPVAKLGGVTIVFVHYRTEKEAKEKWEMRKKRINWDNMYVITSDGNEANLEDFKKLDRLNCKRKIIFTSRYRPDIKDSFYLKSLKGKESAAIHMITGHRLTGLWTWLDDWDFVAWLNGEKNFYK